MSASAAEPDAASDSSILILEEETFAVEETTIVEEITEADGQISVTHESDDFSRFNVNADGKVVGSDGVVSDDITYLSKSFSSASAVYTQEREESSVG